MSHAKFINIYIYIKREREREREESTGLNPSGQRRVWKVSKLF